LDFSIDLGVPDNFSEGVAAHETDVHFSNELVISQTVNPGSRVLITLSLIKDKNDDHFDTSLQFLYCSSRNPNHKFKAGKPKLSQARGM
jgi:hypothetical protein